MNGLPARCLDFFASKFVNTKDVNGLLPGGFGTYFLFFIPRSGEDSQFDVHIFSKGLVQPPTR